MSYTIKMKEEPRGAPSQPNPFRIRDVPTQPQMRRRLGPIPMINLQPHLHRKGSEVTYIRTSRAKDRKAVIVAIAVVKNKPAYILDDGHWIFQSQIKG